MPQIISLNNVYKYYKLYDSPKDRLKEALNPFGKKYHKKFYCLEDINLIVQRGEALGIVGKNGSGKSTLLKLICSVLQPSSGTISVKGKVTALLELGGGFNPEFSGLENIHFYARLLGFSNKQIISRIDEIIAFADIGEFIYQPVKNYSSGMKSRLGFSVAVHVEPEILILDEVLAVGDAQFRRKCYRKMKEFFDCGKTILFVSHTESAILEHCTRAILLKDHRVAIEGTPDEVVSAYRQDLFKNDELKKSPVENEKTNLQESGDVNRNNVVVRADSYIKDLNSTPVFTNRDIVDIKNVRIYDFENKLVNLLIQGKRYKINFNCMPSKNLKDVSVGAQIRTLSGQLVSGANMVDYEKSSIAQVGKDQEVKCFWEFDCLLVPGLYIVYLFVMSESSRDTVIMEDAIMFKVENVIKQNGGVVSLNQSIGYTVQGRQ